MAGRVPRRQLAVHGALQFVLQAKQAGFRRDQVPLQFGKPLRMGKIAGAQQGDAFAARPMGHVRQISVPTGGSRVLGMDVQIGVEHPRQAPCLRTGAFVVPPIIRRRAELDKRPIGER